MEAQEIIQYIGFGLVGIVLYFLRGIISDVKNLKEAKSASETQNLLNQQKIITLETKISDNEKTMFKKFSGIHTREEKQRETNQELHSMLARIEGKLDTALNLGK